MREEPRGKTRGNFALGWIPEMILTLSRYLRFNAVVNEVGTLLDISQILFMFKLYAYLFLKVEVFIFMKQCSGVSIYIQCQGELKSIIGVPTMTGSKNQDVGCVFHVRYPRKPSENKNKIKFSYFVFITSVTSQYLTCNTQLLRNTLL